MKVLHLPTSVGGNSWGLSRGERRLGLDSRTLVLDGTWLNYPVDVNLEIRRYRRIGKLFKLAKIFLSIRRSYDVFHFNYGSSLIDYPKYGIPLLDLPWYPKDKVIVFTYNGCDARQKYVTMARESIAACHEKNCYEGLCNSGREDVIRRAKIQKVQRYAHHIFAVNPDLLRVLPPGATFLPYTVAEWENIRAIPYNIGKRLTIVHAPTNQATKGTPHILAALNKLKEHYPIDVALVEGMSNKQAMQILRGADLVIDQILVGWYGGLAVEAMRAGKPVVSFVRESDLGFLPHDMARDVRDAVINAHPFNLFDVLSTYLQNPALLAEKSRAALEYVHRWHDPVRVAGVTKAAYERAMGSVSRT